MSADLELRPEFLEIRLPTITVKVSQSSEITEDDGTTGEECCRTPKSGKPSVEEEEFHTPKSPRHMIPKIINCPPAPRKPRTKMAFCKRKLCELQFFEVVAKEEFDSFFRQFDVNSKRRCLA